MNCCECAFKILISTILSAVLIVVVIGLIIYFAVYYKKDEVPPETNAQLSCDLLIPTKPCKELSNFSGWATSLRSFSLYEKQARPPCIKEEEENIIIDF
uniref:Uncharacterized protein n=1 Tax=Glossina brevipalpis TaxID=37001 RepID=A0A1A9W4D6_9MUSC